MFENFCLKLEGCPCADNQSCGRETLSCSVGAGKCLYDSVNNDGKCQEGLLFYNFFLTNLNFNFFFEKNNRRLCCYKRLSLFRTRRMCGQQ